MQLTKTGFIQYLNCPKSLWLRLHAPDEYPHGEFSAFLQKLTREGYEVERYVRRIFEESGRAVNFQRVFETSDGLYARADVLEEASDGSFVLYEVKSSTSVKTDAAHNHLKDACFQKICAERGGQKVDAVSIIHLNGEYVRDGEIDPVRLLTITDVSAEVAAIEEATAGEIDEALALLQEMAADRNGCSCLQKSRANHCDTFALFNPAVPSPSIYSLPRLHQNKRSQLVAEGIFDLSGIPDAFQLSPPQRAVVEAAKAGTPLIDVGAVRGFLAGMAFPLHFLDYETYASAVPLLDRTSPHKQFPVQYSLHMLEEDGSLSHHEYLEREARLPDRLLQKLSNEIGASGSVVSWHASFEKDRNREMAALFPVYAEFLDGVNGRMVDLEDVFKASYIDARFDGSTSIKKVLPVLCPELSYKELGVQDGASAMDAWEKMIGAEGAQADRIASELLEYCKLDTFAMVEIYRFLVRVSKTEN